MIVIQNTCRIVTYELRTVFTRFGYIHMEKHLVKSGTPIT